MSQRAFSCLNYQGWHWTFSSHLSPDFICQLITHTYSQTGELIQQNLHRSVFRLSKANETVYLKCHHYSRWKDRFSIWMGKQEKAHHEWNILHWLHQHGLSVVRPLAMGVNFHFPHWVQKSLLVTQEASGIPLSQAIRQNTAQGSCALLARWLSRAFSLGLFHPDLHLENFLWDPSHEHLTGLDFHSAQIAVPCPLLKIYSLSKLTHALALEGFYNYLHQLLSHLQLSSKEVELLKRLSQRREKIRLKSRLKRIFQRSSQFQKKTHKGQTWYWRTSHSWEELQRLCQSPPPQWQVETFPRSQRQRAREYWILSRWLELLGVASPQPVAYWHSWREAGLLWPPPLPLAPLKEEHTPYLAKALWTIHHHPYLGHTFQLEQWGVTEEGQLGVHTLDSFTIGPSPIQDNLDRLKRVFPQAYQHYQNLEAKELWFPPHL